MQKLNRAVEQQLWDKGYQKIAGVDEAGRGPLAGPVVAAACVCGPGVAIEGVDDSKKLTHTKRVALLDILRAHADVAIGVGIVDAEMIDQINILQATIRAMHLAIASLPTLPDYVVVDGRPIPHPQLPLAGVVGGDSSVFAISCASIVAKVTRDQMMERYHESWPEYGFVRHKGYGTRAHLKAIGAHGPCPIHRKTFRGVIR